MYYLWFGVMYLKASDWLRYNHKKRVKTKHNDHLLLYPGFYLSKTGTMLFLPIAWLVGCVLLLILKRTVCLVGK